MMQQNKADSSLSESTSVSPAARAFVFSGACRIYTNALTNSQPRQTSGIPRYQPHSMHPMMKRVNSMFNVLQWLIERGKSCIRQSISQ
ncbi:MAG TPA: hypothetical protein VGN04_11770, partial [Herbaspirillum sp.]